MSFIILELLVFRCSIPLTAVSGAVMLLPDAETPVTQRSPTSIFRCRTLPKKDDIIKSYIYRGLLVKNIEND